MKQVVTSASAVAGAQYGSRAHHAQPIRAYMWVAANDCCQTLRNLPIRPKKGFSIASTTAVMKRRETQVALILSAQCITAGHL